MVSRVLLPGMRFKNSFPTCKIEISLVGGPIFDPKDVLNSGWCLVFNMIFSDFSDFFWCLTKIREFGTRVRAWFEPLRFWIDLSRWVLFGYCSKSESVKSECHVRDVFCLHLKASDFNNSFKICFGFFLSVLCFVTFVGSVDLSMKSCISICVSVDQMPKSSTWKLSLYVSWVAQLNIRNFHGCFPFF